MMTKLIHILRLNHPMLWNIRIVPMACVILGLYVLLFALGYLGQAQYTQHLGNSAGLYFMTFICGLLLFIGWLVVYSRNNGFRYFAPRSTAQLWGEWALILALCSSLCALPLAHVGGAMTRLALHQDMAQAQENRRLLDTVKILLPYYVDPYEYVADQHQALPIPAGMTLIPEQLNMDDYAVRPDATKQLVITGYKGHSLLFYHNPNPEQQRLLQWLRQGSAEPVLALMTQYQTLQKKNGIQPVLTPEAWWASINQPPFFALSEGITDPSTVPFNTIASVDYQRIDDWETLSERQDFTLNIDNARLEMLLLPLSFALFWGMSLSLLIFSYRLSTGRVWLKAALCAGVLLLLSGFMASGSGVFVFTFFWVMVFALTLLVMYNQLRLGDPKRLTHIAMHYVFWLPPWLLVMTFDALSRGRDDDLFDPFGLTYIVSLWVLMPLLMPVLIAFVRRWQALPEA